MYDIKVLTINVKWGGGDVSPQCFVKDLLWVVNLVCKKEDSVYCWFKAHQDDDDVDLLQLDVQEWNC
jgi:hypothetical protein